MQEAGPELLLSLMHLPCFQPGPEKGEPGSSQASVPRGSPQQEAGLVPG